MRSRRERLADSLLYVLIDRQVCARQGIEIIRLAENLRDAGAGLVQLRDKVSSCPRLLEEAALLAGVFKGSETLFILNDHPQTALQAGCDGVHLGQSDGPVRDARRLMGEEPLIGVSCSNEEQARAAQSAGADYLGIGPVFPTDTKDCVSFCGPQTVAALAHRITIPFFCIGGISAADLPELLSAGATRAAVCSAVIGACDPAAEFERMNGILKKGLDDEHTT